MTEIVQLITAFLGSLGFGLIFNVGKKNLFLGSLGGLFAWSIYLLGIGPFRLNLIFSTIIAAAFAQIYSEILARICKAPATLFTIPTVVPLIPGGALYRTMNAVVFGDWISFRSIGMDTLQTTFGIAIGTSFVVGLMHLIRQFRNKKIS